MTDKRPRGRPRPQETIERDQKILSLLRDLGPRTRNTIAEDLGLSVTIVYLSLDRLRREDKVQIRPDTNGPGAVWMVNGHAGE